MLKCLGLKSFCIKLVCELFFFLLAQDLFVFVKKEKLSTSKNRPNLHRNPW